MKEYNLKDKGEGETIAKISGRILKIFLIFYNKDGLDKLEIWTKEGEKVIDTHNNKEKYIFYPRINISREVYNEVNMDFEGTINKEHYCSMGFLIRVTSQGKKENIVKEIRILYE